MLSKAPCWRGRTVSAGRLVQTGLKAGLWARSDTGVLLFNEQNRLLLFTTNLGRRHDYQGEQGTEMTLVAPLPRLRSGSAATPGPGPCHSCRGVHGLDPSAGPRRVCRALVCRGPARARGNGGPGG